MLHPIRRMLHDVIPILWGNWISLVGTTLATVAGNVFLVFLIVDLATSSTNTYAAGIAYLVMPGVFIGGLVLIAVGHWRKKHATSQGSTLQQALDLIANDRKTARRITFVIVATLANISIVSLAAYKGVTYSNSPQFCGQMCHSVMEPEYTVYQDSPHARVACVECHIGAGADWFARSKISGLRQVWATMLGNFSRPIPTPVHNLRPARETCEQCHWPAKFHGSRLLVRHHFLQDEENTRETNVVQLNVGGVNKETGKYEGIHWHVSPNVQVRYQALNEKRTKIGKVTVIEDGEVKRTFNPPADEGASSGSTDVHEQRTMDCIDCHNRPTHIYAASPETALDKALAYNKISSDLPFIKKQSVELLKDTSHQRERAATIFQEKLKQYYQENYPEIANNKHKAIVEAATVLARIYRENVYPRLKITWGTYPSHLGHRNTQEGCFRCHDDEHTTSDDHYLAQDCDICHDVIAEEESEPDIPESMLKLGSM